MRTSPGWKKVTVVAAFIMALFSASFAPSYAFLDKTRFVAHLGIAYFCFHHWVLKPYTEGAFANDAPHRTATIVKGGVALLFAVHEVQVAQKIAHESKDPLLQKLDGGVGALATSFSTIGQKLKGGTFDPHDVDLLKTVTGAVTTGAAADGAKIKDIPAPLPGA